MPAKDTGSAVAIYRGMYRAALDAAYNNTEAVADSHERLGEWSRLSEIIRASERATLDLRYGQTPRACLDYFAAGAGAAPLFAFIHGGYWQRNSKDTFAFLAEGR